MGNIKSVSSFPKEKFIIENRRKSILIKDTQKRNRIQSMDFENDENWECDDSGCWPGWSELPQKKHTPRKAKPLPEKKENVASRRVEFTQTEDYYPLPRSSEFMAPRPTMAVVAERLTITPPMLVYSSGQNTLNLEKNLTTVAVQTPVNISQERFDIAVSNRKFPEDRKLADKQSEIIDNSTRCDRRHRRRRAGNHSYRHRYRISRSNCSSCSSARVYHSRIFRRPKFHTPSPPQILKIWSDDEKSEKDDLIHIKKALLAETSEKLSLDECRPSSYVKMLPLSEFGVFNSNSKQRNIPQGMPYQKWIMPHSAKDALNLAGQTLSSTMSWKTKLEEDQLDANNRNQKSSMYREMSRGTQTSHSSSSSSNSTKAETNGMTASHQNGLSSRISKSSARSLVTPTEDKSTITDVSLINSLVRKSNKPEQVYINEAENTNNSDNSETNSLNLSTQQTPMVAPKNVYDKEHIRNRNFTTAPLSVEKPVPLYTNNDKNGRYQQASKSRLSLTPIAVRAAMRPQRTLSENVIRNNVKRPSASNSQISNGSYQRPSLLNSKTPKQNNIAKTLNRAASIQPANSARNSKNCEEKPTSKPIRGASPATKTLKSAISTLNIMKNKDTSKIPSPSSINRRATLKPTDSFAFSDGAISDLSDFTQISPSYSKRNSETGFNYSPKNVPMKQKTNLEEAKIKRKNSVPASSSAIKAQRLRRNDLAYNIPHLKGSKMNVGMECIRQGKPLMRRSSRVLAGLPLMKPPDLSKHGKNQVVHAGCGARRPARRGANVRLGTTPPPPSCKQFIVGRAPDPKFIYLNTPETSSEHVVQGHLSIPKREKSFNLSTTNNQKRKAKRTKKKYNEL